MSDQFSFISDPTVRDKLAIAQANGVEMMAPVNVGSRTAVRNNSQTRSADQRRVLRHSGVRTLLSGMFCPMGSTTINRFVVILAKAGIHFDFSVDSITCQ